MAIARKPKKSKASEKSSPVKKRKPAAESAPATDGEDEGSGRSTPLGLEIDAEVLEFIEALDRFKKSNNRPFPSWSEVLFVLKELGYRRG